MTRVASRCVVLIACALACASAPVLETSVEDRFDAVMVRVRDFDDLVDVFGRPPERCVGLSAARRLCQWPLDRRDRSWTPIARSVPTRDRVRVICELPSETGEREAGSCSVHPQRSNREYWRPIPEQPLARPGDAERRASDRDARRGEAIALLATATDLVAMSRLVGAVPDACLAPEQGPRRCTWIANSRSFGHGTLAASIGTSLGNRVQLRCEFPEDGGPRAADSCRVSVP